MASLNIKKVVLVGIYLEGIYPRGDNAVEANLLAPAILKAAADADNDIKQKYEIKLLNLPASLSSEDVAKKITDENPVAVGFSAYVWNMDLIAQAGKLVRASQSNALVYPCLEGFPRHVQTLFL